MADDTQTKPLKRDWLFIAVWIAVVLGVVAMYKDSQGTTFIRSVNVPGQQQQEAAESFLDVTWWDLFDSATDHDPQKGDAPVIVEAAITTCAPMSTNGTNSLCNNADGFDEVLISSQNYDMVSGVVGFYFLTFDNTLPTAANIWRSTDTSSGSVHSLTGDDSVGPSTWTYRYGGTLDQVRFATLPNTTYYIELAWDSTEGSGWCSRARASDVSVGEASWQTNSTCDAASPTSSGNPGFFCLGGNCPDVKMDQPLISNDPLRNLFTIRDRSSYPD